MKVDLAKGNKGDGFRCATAGDRFFDPAGGAGCLFRFAMIDFEGLPIDGKNSNA
jgi:hypothetical protein